MLILPPSLYQVRRDDRPARGSLGRPSEDAPRDWFPEIMLLIMMSPVWGLLLYCAIVTLLDHLRR